MFRIVILCIVVFLNRDTFGQGSDEPVSVEELAAGKSAIILDEDLEINIYGRERNVTDGDAEAYRAFRFRRTMTIKILTSDGIRIFNKMILPESFDPTFIAHGSDVKNLGVYYSAYKIDQFKITVKRDRKKAFSPDVKKKIQTIESFNINYLYDYSRNIYMAGDVRVGDEVTVTYDIEIPFQENYSRFASYRIFFHDSIPKLKYNLKLTHHESIDLELYQKNGVTPSKPVVIDGIVSRTWSYENLPGCIREAGSRPYTELPHLTWVMNFYKYYIHNSTSEKNIPHYAIIASLKSPELTDILTSVQIGSKTKQFTSFENAFEKFSGGKPVDYETVKNVHQDIVENFKYEDDREYYRRNDMRTERLGEYFGNGVLRDKSRYNIYYALMAFAKQNFFSVFLTDIRSGEYSNEYFQPAFDNDFLLATYLGERELDLILPKRHRVGWYYNEIPFYWEDCPAKVVHITDYATSKQIIKENTVETRTPLTRTEDNVRLIKLKAVADLDHDTIIFTGSVGLSGQYSTMCRQAYQNGYRDPSVNKKYNKPLWDIIAGSKQMLSEKQFISPIPPFSAEYAIQFKTGGKIHRENESYRIDLSRWFAHILPDLHEESKRFLTYYPDFTGSDGFEFEIQFVRPVELEEKYHVSENNAFASYSFMVEQLSPLSIKVSSALQVKKPMVSPQDIQEVNDIYRLISASDKFQLTVK